MAKTLLNWIWEKAIDEFFGRELGVYLFPVQYRKVEMADYIVTYMFPFEFSKTVLTDLDISFIKEFFTKRVGFWESRSFENGFSLLKEKKVTNGVITFGFAYNTRFEIGISVSYAKINGGDYFILNRITISNSEYHDADILKLTEIAEKVLTRYLGPSYKGYYKEEIEKELEKSIVDMKDKYCKVKELIDVLDEFGVPYEGHDHIIYIKSRLHDFDNDIFITENGTKIKLEIKSVSEKSLTFMSPDGLKTRKVSFDQDVMISLDVEFTPAPLIVEFYRYPVK